MKKNLFKIILLVLAVALSSAVFVACGEGSGDSATERRQAIEKKLTDAGFEVITSSPGAGLIEGSIIATNDGGETTIIISIYVNESDVPQAATDVTKPCGNLYLTSTDADLVAEVYDLLK